MTREPAVRSAPPTAGTLRGFMAAYYTGVTVVTSIDAQGRPHGMTCTSLTSVTLDPPTLLVCLHVGSGTLAAVGERAEFAVNLLSADGQPAAELFASPGRDRYERVAWRPSPRLGLPWLHDDALAVAECRLARRTAVGDHIVIYGAVVNVENDGGDPLLYGGRAYGFAPAG